MYVRLTCMWYNMWCSWCAIGSLFLKACFGFLMLYLVMPQNLYSLAMDAQNLHLKMPSSDSDLIIALVRYLFCQYLIQKKGILISQGSFAV